MTTEELRALERAKDAVIEAARRHKAARNFFSACDCGVCKALDALDSAAPSATAGAEPFTQEQRWEIEKEIAQKICEHVESQHFDILKRLSALEASRLSSPVRAPEAEQRFERIETEMHSILGRLWKLEPVPAPPAEPDGGEVTALFEEYRERADTFQASGWVLGPSTFLACARQLSAAAEKRGMERAANVAEDLEWGSSHIQAATAIRSAISEHGAGRGM